MKTGPVAFGTAGNDSGSAKHENDSATLFRALRTAFLVVGDGMRKKDTEIPPKRAFV
jgi:hypothetical protein